MKSNSGSANWFVQTIVALVGLAVLVFILVSYLPLIQRNQRMGRELERLATQQTQLQETSRQLRAEIEALRHDPPTVARLAREKLGYAKPDETVVRFESPTTNAGQ
jgi:cell division protein FtsB